MDKTTGMNVSWKRIGVSELEGFLNPVDTLEKPYLSFTSSTLSPILKT
jgi:hypothetical protein